jgi:TonB family protein
MQVWAIPFGVLLSLAAQMEAQAPLAVPAAPAQAVPAPQDPVLNVAGREIGNALILRCLCAGDNLSFDAQGKLQGSANGTAPKTTDWTLAGVNVLQAERRPGVGGGPGAIELDAVRVALKYVPDRHEWERHPQNLEKMKILIADSGDVAVFRRALRNVFSMGIDVPLQRSLPDYWRHYFEPSLAWPKDELTGEKALLLSEKLPPGAREATVTKKAEATYTADAERDKVAGVVALRLFVTTEGVAKRVSIAQPLGYGLDERAVEATEKLRFTPTTLANGEAQNSYVVLRQEFVVVGR